jgi:hypothetical protein
MLPTNYEGLRRHLEMLAGKNRQPGELSQGLHEAAAEALALLTTKNASLAVAMHRLCVISQMIREGAFINIE